MVSSNLPNKPQTELFKSVRLTDQAAFENLPSTAFYATRALSDARILLGVSSLIAPHFTCGMFKFIISNETATVARLFGIRGVALGGLLATADDKGLPDGGRRELRRLLWANVGSYVRIYQWAY